MKGRTQKAGGKGTGATGERQPRLEERLERLESLVEALEAEDLELEEALRLFEEGIAHLRAARETLRRAELKVEELLVPDGDEAADRAVGPEPGEPRPAPATAGRRTAQ